jgi:hypothetical protein
MANPTSEQPLAARIARELSSCRQRGLDDLDTSMGHQPPVIAPELGQLAQRYHEASQLDVYGRAAEVRALLRDGLSAYREQGNEAESRFIESLFFGQPGKTPSQLLAKSKEASALDERRFNDYRRSAFERFAAFLIVFVQQNVTTTVRQPHTGEAAAPASMPKRQPIFWATTSVAGIALMAAIVATVVLLLGGGSHQPTSSHSAGAGTSVSSGPRYLPNKTYREETGQYGAPTFTNPFKLSVTGKRIQPYTAVRVSCKLYAPTIASASPDGYWYLVASKPWDNRYYAVANTFINGGKVGGPTNATDFKVPNCPS